MNMDLGKGFNFSVGGGITTDQLFILGAVICGVVLVVGALNFIFLGMIKREMKSEFLRLHEKIDSIAKTLKDVE
ncbi:MAG: hypothetical protein Q8903_13925 [Bacteroidota bacterium]|nr:hypothetical protein [Bacteroidota bacterium]